MNVLMTRPFARFARKAKITAASLVQAAEEVALGEHDADLGGNVFKQRVARPGGGKSGGFRTIILFRIGGHGIFAHGFAKKDKANVTAGELKALKRLASVLLELPRAELDRAIEAGELIRIDGNGDKAQEG